MSDQPPVTATPSVETPQPSPNAAVQRCCQAWRQAWSEEFAKKKDDYYADRKAAAAYRNAMPYLTGRQSIKDFIACVAQGVILTAITPEESARLLYAAQVALGSERLESKPSKAAKASLDT